MITCPYCDSPATLASDAVVYGRSYGRQVWLCADYPACDSYVGCHRGTDTPMGRLSNPELREWKNKAHAAFDPIWRSGYMQRVNAYSWLAGKLGIESADCHIGYFGIEQCQRVIAVCEALKSRKKFKQRLVNKVEAA